MQLFVGTSGYGYKEWKGKFYPEKLSAKQMLSYYGQQFNAVELNNTFRRMPTAESLETLVGQVPKSFRFAVKAPQSITHFKRLRNSEADLEELNEATRALKKQLGPVLFQLPPNFKKDVERLAAFLTLLDKKMLAAFEFRHESWFEDDVFDVLRAHSCALCVADAEETPKARLVRTANWGYIRLRRDQYGKKELVAWVKDLVSQGWEEAFVFFKHEETGAGPVLATNFIELVGQKFP